MGFGGKWVDTSLVDGPDFGLIYKGENAIKVWKEDWGCGDPTDPTTLTPKVYQGTSKKPGDDGYPYDGSYGVHWDEFCFRDELMTPATMGVPARLSKLTIAAIEDLGYLVDYEAADNSGTADEYDGKDTTCGCGCNPCIDPPAETIQPQLSDGARDAAVAYGLELLSQNKLPASLVDDAKNDGLIYVGDKMVFVIIEENGNIYDVLVTSDMGSN